MLFQWQAIDLLHSAVKRSLFDLLSIKLCVVGKGTEGVECSQPGM